jgi:hypothetical protein
MKGSAGAEAFETNRSTLIKCDEKKCGEIKALLSMFWGAPLQPATVWCGDSHMYTGARLIETPVTSAGTATEHVE